MSRLSLTEWYRYLETQYADDAAQSRSRPMPPAEASLAGVAS
jgi:hypothetical protein